MSGAEVVVTEGSLLHGRSLGEVRFSDYHGLIVLALHRSGPGRAISEEISQVRLNGGDVLLVQGAAEKIAALSVQVIMIVVTSLALGLALMRTGGADYLAQIYVALAGGLPPAAVMSGLMLVMAVLTNIVSNNAAAVIGTPIAVNIAQAVGAPAEPFVLAVLFGANLSFATPMAYKTNLLIFAAGGYRFTDFVRAGVPLTIIMWLTLSVVLAHLYMK